jgi:Na+/proline symporter
MVMVLYEWFGGLTTVAITDALQGSLMFIGTIAGCFFINHYYGGFAEARDDLAVDYPTYFYNPSSTTQIKFFSFEFSSSFFVFNGFVIMRIFAAKNYRSIKLAFCTMPAHIGLILPGALTGLQGFSQGLATPTSAAVFAKVAHSLIGKGPLAATFMSLLLVAAMAAVMSTADSLLGMLSAVCANDIGRKFTDGKALPVNTVKAFSVAMMAIGICVYFLFDDLTKLFVLQSSLLMVGLAPAYIFGLFWPGMGAGPVLAGCLMGTAVALGITFGVDIEAQPELQALGNTIGFMCGMFSTIGSHAMQTAHPGSCVDRCLSYLAFLNVNSVEGFSNAHKARYNNSFLDAPAMTIDGPLLKGLHEPLGCARGKIVYAALVMVLFFFVPFYFEAEAEPTYVSGIPLWSFIQLILFGVHTVLVWYLYSLWIDDEEEEDPGMSTIELYNNPLKAKLEAQWKAGSPEGTSASK